MHVDYLVEDPCRDMRSFPCVDCLVDVHGVGELLRMLSAYRAGVAPRAHVGHGRLSSEGAGCWAVGRRCAAAGGGGGRE